MKRVKQNPPNMKNSEYYSSFIIDCHIHTYPTADLSDRDAAYFGYDRKGLTGQFRGTVEDTLAAMRRDGIAKAIMLNWLPAQNMLYAGLQRLAAGRTDYFQAEGALKAQIAERIKRRTRWTCEVAQKHPELIAFLTVDPTVMSPEEIGEEIRDVVINHGARGIKLQNAGMGLFPYDRSLWPIYEAAQELSLPMVVHSGRWGGAAQYTEPKYFAEVLANFPGLRLGLAHLGADFYEQAKILAKICPLVFFDCSDVLCHSEFPLSDEQLMALMREVGTSRIVFGSDFPFFDRLPLLQRLFNLNLTKEEKRQILGENARRIFGL